MTTHLDGETNRMSKLEMQGRGDPLWCHLDCHLHCIMYPQQKGVCGGSSRV